MEEQKQTPALPEGISANQILNDYSSTQHAELAREAGVSIDVYVRFLEKKARAERVAENIAQIQKTVEQNRSNDIEKQNTDAVIQGTRSIVTKLTIQPIPREQEERAYERAYRLLNEIDRTTNLERRRKLIGQAEDEFEKVVRGRAVHDLLALLGEGKTFTEAQDIVSTQLQHASKRQNIALLEEAYATVSRQVAYDYFHQKIRRTLDQLVHHYDTSTMSADDTALLKRLIQCAKGAYFKGKLTDEIVHRYGLLEYKQHLAPVVKAYAEYGLHKTSSENVAGPSEVYTPVQSGGDMGYSRSGRRRPHRGTPDDERH